MKTDQLYKAEFRLSGNVYLVEWIKPNGVYKVIGYISDVHNGYSIGDAFTLDSTVDITNTTEEEIATAAMNEL